VAAGCGQGEIPHPQEMPSVTLSGGPYRAAALNQWGQFKSASTSVSHIGLLVEAVEDGPGRAAHHDFGEGTGNLVR
jgi:hypothetical protein